MVSQRCGDIVVKSLDDWKVEETGMGGVSVEYIGDSELPSAMIIMPIMYYEDFGPDVCREYD